MSGPDRIRVAVTGIGVVSPAGSDVSTLESTLLAGRSVIATDPELVAANSPVTMSARVADFEPTDRLTRKEARRLDIATQFGLTAAMNAIDDAGPFEIDPTRGAVITGTGVGSIHTIENQFVSFVEGGPRGIAPLTVPATMSNATAAMISIHQGWTGPSTCIVTACAAGAQAIGEGASLIRAGRADVVLAGGFETAVTPFNIAAFWRIAALSSRCESPSEASRPFDAGRDGFVMGEGAAFLVLERHDLAIERGARIHAELAGFGWNNDSHHLTSPSPSGRGATVCMQQALDDAGFVPADVRHVNAHGTSTRVNDLLESAAILDVFGPAVPVTASKGIFGHLIGAAGAVEAVATIATMNGCAVPPTANCEVVDPEVHVDVVRGSPRPIEPGPALTNSFGFGGHNVSLLFCPVDR